VSEARQRCRKKSAFTQKHQSGTVLRSASLRGANCYCMDQSLTPGVEAPPSSRTQIWPPAGSLGPSESRRLLLTSAVSTTLAVTLPVADWMIWARSSLNPLLILATVLLLGAAVAGVSDLRRWWPRSLDKQGVSAAIQSLLFELGLLLTVTWIVDLVIRMFIEK